MTDEQRRGAREVLEGRVDRLEQVARSTGRSTVADRGVGGRGGARHQPPDCRVGTSISASASWRASRRRAGRTAPRTADRAARCRRSRCSARSAPATRARATRSPSSASSRLLPTPASPASKTTPPLRGVVATSSPASSTPRISQSWRARLRGRQGDGWDVVQRARDPSFPAAPTGPQQYRARCRESLQSQRPQISEMPGRCRAVPCESTRRPPADRLARRSRRPSRKRRGNWSRW